VTENTNYSIQIIKNICWWTLFFIFLSIVHTAKLAQYSGKQGEDLSYFFLPIITISYLIFWAISLSLLVFETKDLNIVLRRFVGLIIHIPLLIHAVYFLISKIT